MTTCSTSPGTSANLSPAAALRGSSKITVASISAASISTHRSPERNRPMSAGGGAQARSSRNSGSVTCSGIGLPARLAAAQVRPAERVRRLTPAGFPCYPHRHDRSHHPVPGQHGDGIAEVAGVARQFVPFTLPGERVDIARDGERGRCCVSLSRAPSGSSRSVRISAVAAGARCST